MWMPRIPRTVCVLEGPHQLPVTGFLGREFAVVRQDNLSHFGITSFGYAALGRSVVADLVLLVFFVCSVGEVVQPVVQRIIIEMSDYLGLLLRADEGCQNKSMNVMHLMHAEHGEVHLRVSTPDSRLQYSLPNAAPKGVFAFFASNAPLV